MVDHLVLNRAKPEAMWYYIGDHNPNFKSITRNNFQLTVLFIRLSVLVKMSADFGSKSKAASEEWKGRKQINRIQLHLCLLFPV